MYSYLDIRAKKGQAEELNRRYREHFSLPKTSYLVFDAAVIAVEINKMKSDASSTFAHLGKYINDQKDWAMAFPERAPGYGQVEISGFQFHESPSEQKAACKAIINFLLRNGDVIDQIKNLEFAKYIGLIEPPRVRPIRSKSKIGARETTQVSLF